MLVRRHFSIDHAAPPCLAATVNYRRAQYDRVRLAQAGPPTGRGHGQAVVFANAIHGLDRGDAPGPHHGGIIEAFGQASKVPTTTANDKTRVRMLASGIQWWLVAVGAIVTVAVLAGVLGWYFSKDDPNDSINSIIGARQQPVTLEGSIVAAGLASRQQDISANSDLALDACSGMEEGLVVPAGSCSILLIEKIASRDEGSASTRRRALQVGEAQTNGSRHRFTFYLRLLPLHRPELDDVELHALLWEALYRAVVSGELLETFRTAGSGSLQALEGIAAPALLLAVRQPSPTPGAATGSSSPTASYGVSPAVTPSNTPVATFVAASQSPETSVQPPEPTAVPLPSGDTQPIQVTQPQVQLALSTEDSITRLIRTSSGRTPRPAGVAVPVPCGRSYDGHDWESQHPCLVRFNCTGAGNDRLCGAELPMMANYSYWLETSELGRTPSHAAQASRFLMHGAFGPTYAGIDRFPASGANFADDARAWMQHQLQVPYTLHRAHYRRLANPRSPGNTVAGRPREACESGSRWMGFAVTQFDQGATFEFVNDTLIVNGYPRTYVEGAQMPPEAGDGPWRVCYVQERVGGYIQYATMTSPCQFAGTNPPMIFQEGSEPVEYMSTTELGVTVVPVARPASDVFVLESPPSSCRARRAGPVFMRAAVEPAGPGAPLVWLQLQRRLRIVDNTPENPANHRAVDGLACPTAPKTPLNAHLCVIAPGCGKPTIEPENALLTLNASVIRSLYEESGIYVYYVTGLKMDSTVAPCGGTSGQVKSRWYRVQPSACSNAAAPGSASLDNSTHALLSNAIMAADDGADVIDVSVEVGGDSACTRAAKGVRINVQSGSGSSAATMCWQHVHQDERSVLDFTYWTRSHPGNQNARNQARRNPITAVAERGEVRIYFPSYHAASYWEERRAHHPVIGRLNGPLRIADLPPDLRTPYLLRRVGVTQSSSADALDDTVEVCGSYGEVGNDPYAGDKYTMALDGNVDVVYYDLDYYAEGIKGQNTKSNVWVNAVLDAPDQLRQRVAWALEQLLVVNEGGANRELDTEVFAAYHDIMVRHSLGSFRELLREVALSPIMGTMLTYQGSNSLYVTQELLQYPPAFPDENFAREILYLFTIGLWELNADGTRKVDASGGFIPTYSNADILEYSRLWTGLGYQPVEIERANIETVAAKFTPTGVDPMRIFFPQSRDSFPKLGLRGRFIGDHYPACWDLPNQHFLRPGARYHYLGNSPVPRLQTDPEEIAIDGTKRMVLDAEDSELYALLCGERGLNTTCSGTLRSLVVLNRSISCHGAECLADTLRVVYISRGPGRKPVYFEYERPPCVEFAFVENGHGRPTSWYTIQAMCVDQRAEAAAGACCPLDGSNPAGRVACGLYQGERIRYATAEARCNAAGQTLCQTYYPATECGNWGDRRQWGTSRCTTRVRVFPDGRVQALHEMTGHFYGSREARVSDVRDNYKFRVGWSNGFPRNSADPLANGRCVPASGGTVSCEVDVVAEVAFDYVPENYTVIAEALHVGANDPLTTGDAAEYSLCTTPACSLLGYNHGVEVFLRRDSNGTLDSTTIFRATVGGRPRFLANVHHQVRVSDRYSFRNPPVMMTVWEDAARNAYQETDAAIDHYLYHENVPPFLATFLIKRLTVSNPSPRYVYVVADAFRSGLYQGVGTGEFGDLAATAAAVLLDREALSPTLEADPSHGKLREPLLKVMHLFRALGLQAADGHVIELFEMERRLGQLPFKSPSVFNFYQDDFQPPGALVDAQLTAPEAYILNTPTIMGWLNGVLSLLEFGLTSCEGGFGSRTWAQVGTGVYCDHIGEGLVQPDPYWAANLTWMPGSAAPSDVAEELDLLLTGGRMSPWTKSVIASAIRSVRDTPGSSTLDERTAAVHLATSAPEFHTLGVGHTPTQSKVSPTESPDGADAPTTASVGGTEADGYHLVVFLNFNGGCDSYNMLVPLSGCQNDMDLYAHYQQVRGDVALPTSYLLEVDVPTGSQPCDRFGIHHRLPILQQLYDDGDAVFIANIGPLVEPVTRDEVERGTAPVPDGLFAHNLQTKVTYSVYAQDPSNVGVLGRIRDALYRQGQAATAYSINGNSIAVQGEPGQGPSPDIVDSLAGVVPFDARGRVATLSGALESLVRNGSRSFMADSWSRQLASALERSRMLAASVERNGTLYQPFAAAVPAPNTAPSQIALQLEQAARLVSARKALGSTRDMVFVELGGFDSHSDLFQTHDGLFQQINEALDSFIQEMRLQGVWENVTIVQTSEFGRTLTSNGAGTDHGWAGNTFVVGGSVRGGRVHGQYPTDLSEDGSLNLGRGRLIPTTGWEAVWNAVAQRFGVDKNQMSAVLPNLSRFPAGSLLEPEDLFV